jgi:putative monooxygenase
MIRVIDPFAQAHPAWPGLDDTGHRRKVFKVVDQHLNASQQAARPT